MRSARRRAFRLHVRAGLTLIEVLVAVAILGMGIASWASLAGQGVEAIRVTAAREAEFQMAANEMARASLWSRRQFEASVGVHRLERLRVAVAQPDPVLFNVAVTDSAGVVLLATSFYRRDSSAVQTR